jgi:hypothetical protein
MSNKRAMFIVSDIRNAMEDAINNYAEGHDLIDFLEGLQREIERRINDEKSQEKKDDKSKDVYRTIL